MADKAQERKDIAEFFDRAKPAPKPATKPQKPDSGQKKLFGE